MLDQQLTNLAAVWLKHRFHAFSWEKKILKNFSNEFSRIFRKTSPRFSKILEESLEKKVQKKVQQKFQMAWENEKSRRWVDDEAVTACQKCSEPFTMLVRRHHCRKCGGIFCYNCSNYTLVLASSSKPQRVCEPCSFAWSYCLGSFLCQLSHCFLFIHTKFLHIIYSINYCLIWHFEKT